MSLMKHGWRYARDDMEGGEPLDFALTAYYTPGAINLGFRRPNDPEEVGRFLQHQGPDGQPLLQPHGDRERLVYGWIDSAHPSVGAMARTLNPDDYRRFADDFLQASREADLDVFGPRVFGRTGAGGKTVLPAEMLAHYRFNGVTRRGESIPHAHVEILQGVHIPGVGVRSAADNRVYYRLQKDRTLQFHLRLADKCELRGWRMAIENGRAVALDAHPALVAAAGSGQRAIAEHLKSLGIKATPASKAVAALATQPEKQVFRLDERLKTWKQEAQQLIQQGDRTRPQRPEAPTNPVPQQSKPAASPRPTPRPAQPSAKPAPPQRPPGPGVASQAGPAQGQAQPKQALRAKPQPGLAQPQDGPVMGPAGSGQFVLSNQRPVPKAQAQQGQSQQQARQTQAGQGQAKQARQAKPSPQAGQGQAQHQKQGPQPVAHLQARGKKAGGQGQPNQGQGARNAQGQGFGYTARPSGTAGPAPQPSKGRWGRLADGLAQEIKLRARFAKEVWKTYRANGAKREVRVDNVAAFLQDTRRRSRREGHLAARRSLKEADWQKLGLKGTLGFAREAYKAGRQPALKVARGAKVIIRHDAPAMTPGEFRSLQARAEKYGWDLRLCGIHRQHLKGQQQGQAANSQQAQNHQKAQNQGQQQANAQQQAKAARPGRTLRRSTP